nr:MAG TPA: hypothetical protein [Caudoviricetes sp.]
MIKVKSKVKPVNGKVQAFVKMKVTPHQEPLISQYELVALLMGYRDVVLKDYTDFAAVQHIKEAVEVMEKELNSKGDK